MPCVGASLWKNERNWCIGGAADSRSASPPPASDAVLPDRLVQAVDDPLEVVHRGVGLADHGDVLFGHRRHLLDVARGMLATIPLSSRERARFQKRMQCYLVNILHGLPVNDGLLPSRPTEAHSVQASRARKYIPQAAHGASATAAY